MTTHKEDIESSLRSSAPPLEGWAMGYPSRRGPKSFSERKVPLKGLFSDGIWKCNCDPRLPAERFQTKNGGKNHGRWFYTCQKAQHQRCNFFLWDDDAKPREGKAVLNNSRDEPMTPVKSFSHSYNSTTPSRRGVSTSPAFKTPYETPSKLACESPTKRLSTNKAAPIPIQSDSEEFFGWPASDEEEMVKAADQAIVRPPETPHKAAKLSANATPRKRLFDDMQSPDKSFLTTYNDDVFSTPPTSTKHTNPSISTGLLSPLTTPAPNRFRNVAGEDSDLATEVLDSLKKLYVPMPTEAITAVKDIAAKQTMKTQGIAKGRDISRAAIKTKDGTIAELQGKIAALEAEVESNRTVIAHLRRTLETRERIEALDEAGKGNYGRI